LKNRDARSGFTLIELIVVIAIIVVLVALIAPNATKLVGTASQTTADANAKSGYTAAMSYITDSYVANGTYPTSAEVTSGLRDYLTADTVKGTYSVEYSQVGGELVSCTYTEGSAVGIYPKDAQASNLFVSGVNASNVMKSLAAYLSGSVNKEINSEGSLNYTNGTVSRTGTIVAALKAQGVDITTGSWRIAYTAGGGIALYWTGTSIGDSKVGDTVVVKKYVQDANGKFVYDSTGTAPVATNVGGDKKKINVIGTYKAN